MKDYLIELRQNRGVRATQVIKDSLVSHGVEVGQLRKGFLREIALLQNQTRGPLFELMAEVIIGNAFKVNSFDKQAVFKTPYGDRKVDLFIPEHGVAIEVKSGYARLSRFIKLQIQKDKYILDNEAQVKQVVWICFRGATSFLVSQLKKSGLEYCDIEYDKFDVPNDKIERTIIRA